MNTTEGLRRIAKVIRVAGVLFALPFVFKALVIRHSSELELVFWQSSMSALSIFVGCFVLAWIVDGFAKPKSAQQANGNDG